MYTLCMTFDVIFIMQTEVCFQSPIGDVDADNIATVSGPKSILLTSNDADGLEGTTTSWRMKP